MLSGWDPVISKLAISFIVICAPLLSIPAAAQIRVGQLYLGQDFKSVRRMYPNRLKPTRRTGGIVDAYSCGRALSLYVRKGKVIGFAIHDESLPVMGLAVGDSSEEIRMRLGEPETIRSYPTCFIDLSVAQEAYWIYDTRGLAFHLRKLRNQKNFIIQQLWVFESGSQLPE